MIIETDRLMLLPIKKNDMIYKKMEVPCFEKNYY